MKKSILALTLLAASTVVQAEHKWLMTVPELIVSGGVSISQSGGVKSIKFTAQETLCYTAKYFCLNPSAIWLVKESADPRHTGDEINVGAGLDIKYKIPKGTNTALYVEAGPVMFVERLMEHGDSKVNLHVGTGVEYNHFILSMDAYGTEDFLYMVNIGYRL